MLKGPHLRAFPLKAFRVMSCGLAALLAPQAAMATAADHCHIGAYRMNDGRLIDIAPSEGTKLRWRMLDGETGALDRQADGSWRSSFGWTGRPDGRIVSFSDCDTGTLDFAGSKAHRIALSEAETSFVSHGTKLVGRLVLPAGSGPVPIVVLVHGAEHDSALESYFLQRMLPAEGVGAFVYDKRGTGASGGRYSQDFTLLADDVAAATREARRLAGVRAGRIGLQGGSEGGWVAPIAAERVKVDFVIVSFGLAVSVAEEDQEEVALEMRLEGHTPEEIRKAQAVAAAAEEVFATRFRKGLERFDQLRARYSRESWYKDLHGNFTWALLPYSAAELRSKAHEFDWGTPVYYDPMPRLRAAKVPELWIVGSDDLDAPSAKTVRRIRSLIAKGRPFTLAIEPGAEHGMTEYEMKGNERISTRYSAGYFAMMRDFARDGVLKQSYGRARIFRAKH